MVGGRKGGLGKDKIAVKPGFGFQIFFRCLDFFFSVLFSCLCKYLKLLILLQRLPYLCFSLIICQGLSYSCIEKNLRHSTHLENMYGM